MQFTSESLARVLKNVDRETLVNALEEAELTATLVLDSKTTVEDLQGLFNVAVNLHNLSNPLRKMSKKQLLALRGPQKAALEPSDVYFDIIFGRYLSTAVLRELGKYDVPKKIDSLLTRVAKVLLDLLSVDRNLKTALEILGQLMVRVEGEGPQNPWHPEVARIAGLLRNYLAWPAAEYHPTPDSELQLIHMAESLEALL